jgi:hypothetical protein
MRWTRVTSWGIATGLIVAVLAASTAGQGPAAQQTPAGQTPAVQGPGPVRDGPAAEVWVEAAVPGRR